MSLNRCSLLRGSAILIVGCCMYNVYAGTLSKSQEVDISFAPNAFVSAVQDYSSSEVDTSTAEVVKGSSMYASEPISINEEVSIQDLSSAVPQMQQKSSLSLALNERMVSTTKSAVLAKAAVTSVTATTTTITPMCPTLSTGTLYTLNGATTGGAYCYHFNVPSRSKAKVLVTNITEGSDMSLTLFRHELDDSLSIVGQSDNAGDSPELITALTEAGDYYWYIQAIDADGASFSFATILNTYADDYEVNETLSQATVLPDKVNNISANIDEAADYDYYSFEVVRGQEVLFYLTKESSEAPSDQWLFDYYNEGVGAWQRLSNGSGYSPSLSAGDIIKLRVYHNPDKTVHPEYSYRLRIGSMVAEVDWSHINGDNDMRIPYAAVPKTLYDAIKLDEAHNLTTQAYDDISWSIRLLDSSGAPIEGATAVFYYTLVGDSTWSSDISVTNVGGTAGGQISLGSCTENFISKPFYFYDIGGVKSWWQSTFNFGLWYIKVIEAKEGVGVGSTEGKKVSIGHICDHDFLYSEPLEPLEPLD